MDPDSNPNESEPTPPPPPAAQSDDLTDLARQFGNVRKEARGTGEREALKKLGFDDMESAEAAFAELHKRIDAEKTDLERAKERAERAEARIAALESDLTQRQLADRVTAALSAADLPVRALGSAHKLVAVDPDASDDDIAAAVASLREELPQLWIATPDGAPGTPSWAPKGGTGDKKPPSTSKGGLKAGKERYEAMFGSSS